MKRTSVVMFVAALAIGAASFAYAETIDGSIFNEDFNNLTQWNSRYVAGDPSATTSGGLFTLSCTVADQLIEASNIGLMDFSGAADDWWMETSFKVTGDMVGSASRHFVLLSGTNLTGTGVSPFRAVTTIDLRVLPNDGDSDMFDLGWYGWDNGGERNPVILASALDKDAFYNVTLHRKNNNTVDIYLDDIYLTTQDIIVPYEGNQDPASLFMGDISYRWISGSVVYDFVRVGQVVPEPSTLALLAAGLIGLLAYAWRKRK